MAASNRQQILEAIKARLETIAAGEPVPGGDGLLYDTDAGLNVFMLEAPALGEGTPDVAIAVLVGEDTVKWTGMQCFVGLPVQVWALAKASLDAPWEALEQVLADIKRAIEQSDRTLGGLVKSRIERGATVTLEREPGSSTVGLGITYECPYTEVWGNP
jgi:hypothetical protein